MLTLRFVFQLFETRLVLWFRTRSHEFATRSQRPRNHEDKFSAKCTRTIFIWIHSTLLYCSVRIHLNFFAYWYYVLWLNQSLVEYSPGHKRPVTLALIILLHDIPGMSPIGQNQSLVAQQPSSNILLFRPYWISRIAIYLLEENSLYEYVYDVSLI